MRRLDDDMLDPEITASLDAIDATLAGDPVDPRHAELAELALLLRADRPEPSPQFVQSLDGVVERRFDAEPAPNAPGRRTSRRWALAPALGLAAAAVVAVVVSLSSGGGGRPAVSSSGGALAQRSPTVPSAAAPGAAASDAAHTPATLTPGPAVTGPATPSPGLRLPSNNRKIVQSSELALAAAPNRIDDVAQEVFDVVGSQNGDVSSSSVTATGTPSGYAQFQLSVPSATLPETMTALSELRYAHVTSRTDDTNDITSQFSSANAQLTQAQATRTALLKQLQSANSQAAISSLHTQLADVNARISSTQATLRSLGHQVSYSHVSLTVQASSAGPVGNSSGGGFSLSKAAHDAGRVLTVAAGVALIALAVIAPLGLLAGLGWWVAGALRRRRREQALDLA